MRPTYLAPLRQTESFQLFPRVVGEVNTAANARVPDTAPQTLQGWMEHWNEGERKQYHSLAVAIAFAFGFVFALLFLACALGISASCTCKHLQAFASICMCFELDSPKDAPVFLPSQPCRDEIVSWRPLFGATPVRAHHG